MFAAALSASQITRSIVETLLTEALSTVTIWCKCKVHVALK